MGEKEEFFLAVIMVFGTPALASGAKYIQTMGSFDSWIGVFALGLVVHSILWFVTAAILQMALPFIGCHLPFKRALGLAGIAWTPRLLLSLLSIIYSAIASVGPDDAVL